MSSKCKTSRELTPVEQFPPLIDLISQIYEESKGSNVTVKETCNVQGFWECTACTLFNTLSVKACIVCDTKREMIDHKPVLQTISNGNSDNHPQKKRKRATNDTKDGSGALDDVIILVDDPIGQESVRDDTQDNNSHSNDIDGDDTSMSCYPALSGWKYLGLLCSAPGESNWSPIVVRLPARRWGKSRPGKSRFIGANDDVMSVEKLVMQAMYRGELEEEKVDSETALHENVSDISDGVNADKCPAGTDNSSSKYLHVRKAWSRGGWEGWHCEGSVLRSLFGLLMWEELFMSVTDVHDEKVVDGGELQCVGPLDVFITPYQDAPLDLCQPGVFFENR